MRTEIVYKGHDNTINLILKSDGVAQDLSGVTKITATFGTTLVSSEDKAAGTITWDQAGYATGEIRIAAGAMFPAHAGMNRNGIRKPASRTNVPRTRGDEPKGSWSLPAPLLCSPHTRG